MDYKDPLILILNCTVIIVLSLLVLPNLLNKREKLGIRISYSIIFLIVVINCIGNLLIFYFENYHFLGVQFALLCVPFLFGPAVYFYVKEVNGQKVNNFTPHLIIPGIVLIIGLLYNFLPSGEKSKIISELKSGACLPYNLINTLIIVLPIYYFFKTKQFLKHFQLDEQSQSYIENKIKKKWTIEFTNYLFYSIFSFAIIVIVATYILKVPQLFVDLIGMPIYFPFIYAVVAVRSSIISKELEIRHILAKSENEKKFSEERTTVSRDLHDNIGAYANSLIAKIDHISRNEQALKPEEIKDLRDNAETILSLLRQTIWVLNNDEISAESSFDYVKMYAFKIFTNTNIKVRFEEDIVKEISLSASVASNIFRILQEACQNIMKHSKATEVVISLKCDEVFEITVADNGVGFVKCNSRESYGLKNMEQRAKNEGLDLQINSEPGKGSAIKISYDQ